MATPKKSVTKASKGTKRARRNPKRTWNVYVSRSLRSINSQMSMTSRTMKIVNSFVSDLFERIATEAATIVRVNRKRTLGARELQTAVRLGAAGRPRQARNGGGHQGGVTRVQLDAMHTYMRYSRDKGPLRAPPLTVSRTRPLDSQRPSVSANHAKAQHVEVRCPRTALLSKHTHTD
ncbi:putative Core histone H2A H2B H3 H4 [Trypanosoma vivax]|nr:putative Core histone H2A H2B H3 H4 [Trypanosoma vivax]